MKKEEKEKNTLRAAIKAEEITLCGAYFTVEIPNDEMEGIIICGKEYAYYGVIAEKFKKIFEARRYSVNIISKTEKSTVLEFSK